MARKMFCPVTGWPAEVISDPHRAAGRLISRRTGSECTGLCRVLGRPLGVAVIAVVVALDGLASLSESVELLATGERLVAFPAAALGLLLLHRAYALWQVHRGAWLITTLVLGLKVVASGSAIVVGNALPVTWLTLALSIVSVLYLLHPRTRSVFSATGVGR